MREIVLDTETTGLDPDAGHRIVEIACLELVGFMPSGRSFRKYVNPERDMPGDAQAVHGLTREFLTQHPVFADIVDEFLEFIGDAKLVIHNADFDLRFINAELARVGRPPLATDRTIDTVALARQRFPGAHVNLDALCRRFAIDNSARTFHGALLDCQLLAEAYLELCGGRQPGLELDTSGPRRVDEIAGLERPQRPARPHAASAEELAAHQALLADLTNPIWLW